MKAGNFDNIMRTTAILNPAALRKLGAYHFHQGIPAAEGPFQKGSSASGFWNQGWNKARDYDNGFRSFKGFDSPPPKNASGAFKKGYRAAGAVSRALFEVAL